MTKPMTSPSYGRTSAGQFARGNAGGPGRPPGYRSLLAQALDDIQAEDLTAIRDKMIKRAKKGDVQAAKLIFDRSWPAPKSRVVSFDLPKVDCVADIPKAHGAVIDAVTRGILTIAEGVAISGMLEQHRKSFELVEVEGRLSRIEVAAAEAITVRGDYSPPLS